MELAYIVIGTVNAYKHPYDNLYFHLDHFLRAAARGDIHSQLLQAKAEKN